MVTIDSPYSEHGTWLRGNLHTHSTISDGTRDPELVIQDYAARGYDFLALSDHDVFADPAEYQEETNVVLLPAVELSADGPHMLHIGATKAVTYEEDRQTAVDAVLADEGFAAPAHPNWKGDFDHWPQATLDRVEGYRGLEIFNGLMYGHPGARAATDRWDQLLSDGRRIWGYANDDSHRPWDVARGWNVVQVDEVSRAAILEALASGRCYASTGVTVDRIDVTGDTITVEAADADEIHFVTDHGVVQRVVEGSTAQFRVPDHLVHREDHSYVRAECYGQGTDRAWLQPMFLE